MSKKITKEVDYVQINFADNGFIVEYSGQNEDNDYRNAKILVSSVDEMIEQIKVAVEASRFKE
jgi:hypothetical protein